MKIFNLELEFHNPVNFNRKKILAYSEFLEKSSMFDRVRSNAIGLDDATYKEVVIPKQEELARAVNAYSEFVGYRGAKNWLAEVVIIRKG